MNGFFHIKPTVVVKTTGCYQCGLLKTAKTPKISPFGEGKKGILFITDRVSNLEDSHGEIGRGNGYSLLKTVLEEFNLSLQRDCIVVPAICCGKEDQLPTGKEVEICRKNLLKTVSDEMPRLIIPLGTAALQALIGHRWKQSFGGIEKWRGWTIPDQDLRCWICPTFSIHEDLHEDQKTQLRNDLRQALFVGEFPREREPEIRVLDDLSPLQEIQSGTIAFDYETTGIKPQAKGHRILCCSVAVNESLVYAFLMPKTRRELQPFLDLLENPNVGKIAQNMKFEDTWTRVRLRTEIQGWEWDTMLATHIMDNRRDVTGLKFQTYVQFGVIDYSSEISPYLDSRSKDGNALNSIEKLLETPSGRDMLLKYCALDSYYEYRLAMKQQKEMSYEFLPF